MSRKVLFALLAVVVALALAAPALAATSPSAAAPVVAGKAAAPKLTVFAAASLNHVFPAMVPAFKKAYPQYKKAGFTFNFQGTDTLVSQIQAGATCDVFAGASTKYGTTLATAGLINTPVSFCQNKLVVIIPKKNPGLIHTLQDVAIPGKMVAVGDSAVPIGTYTRTVLSNLSKDAAYGSDYSTKVLANVVANCTNVNVVTALVVISEVDAGFVYKSDAQYVTKAVQQITIPDAFQSNPLPTYPIAVTRSTTNAALSQAFVDYVTSAKGQALMVKYGFLPKPAATP
jgi:molybdate transport system substrate-binding protein